MRLTEPRMDHETEDAATTPVQPHTAPPSTTTTVLSHQQPQPSAAEANDRTIAASAANVDCISCPGRIPILFESDRLLIVHKPSGIAHHNDRPAAYTSTASRNGNDNDDDEKEDIDDDDDTNNNNTNTNTSGLGILNVLRRQMAMDLLRHSPTVSPTLVPVVVESPSSTVRDAETETATPKPQPPFLPRLYGVHRLDRVTSGILVLAKDAATAGRIQRAFRDGSIIVKYYIGLSAEKATQRKQGWVRGTMVRGRRKSWYLVREDDPATSHHRDGGSANPPQKPTTTTSQPAKTRFFAAGLGHLPNNNRNATINSSSSSNDTNTTISKTHNDQRRRQRPSPRTLILFRPYTGKTHQLRVAAKSVGLPLLGDPIYGTATHGRTYLHAAAIHIPASVFVGNDDDKNSQSNTLLNNGNQHEIVDHKNVTLWCLPSFQDAWGRQEDTNNAQENSREFDATLHALIRKHCDCPELLDHLPHPIP